MRGTQVSLSVGFAAAALFVTVSAALLGDAPGWLQNVWAFLAVVSFAFMAWTGIRLIQTLPWFERRKAAKRVAAELAVWQAVQADATAARAIALREFEAEWVPWKKFATEAHWLYELLRELGKNPVALSPEIAEEARRRIGLARQYAQEIPTRFRKDAADHVVAVEVALSGAPDKEAIGSTERALYFWLSESGSGYGKWGYRAGYRFN